MNQLVRFDTNALNRALVGFDKMFDDILDGRIAQSNNYPPYNILKRNEDSYELQIAVTGFAPENVNVEIDQNQLVVKAVNSSTNEDEITYLHRGLAGRDFSRSFTLAEHMEVGEGKIKNGILSIEIKRVIPESLKPRSIRINAE